MVGGGSSVVGGSGSSTVLKSRNSQLKSSVLQVQGVHQGKLDLYGYAVKYERLKQAIPTLAISEKNKVLLESYDGYQCARGLSLARKVKYLYILIKICRDFKRDFESFDSQVIQEFRVWVNSSNLSNATKIDYLIAVKKIVEFAGIKTANFKIIRSKQHKLPTELLTDSEVQMMIDYSQRVRDKALITLLYELGARIGEVLNMRVCSVVFDQVGAYVMLDGKTGPRRCRIVKSIILLRAWLAESGTSNPQRFLWMKQNGEPIGYAAVKENLKDTAKAVGIQKRVYPHLFRHSRSTELAKHLTEQQLKVYLGWVPHSDMASVYIHLSGSDCDERILELNRSPVKTASTGDELEQFMEFYKMWKSRR